MSAIAFVENSKEIELINANITSNDLLFIALEPDCIPTLEKKHYRYRIIEDYGGVVSIQNETTSFSGKLVEKIISKTDVWIKSNADGFSKNNLSLLLYYKFYLNILFDGVISRMYYLKKAIDNDKHQSIYICKNEVEKSNSLVFPWENNESIWAYCLETLKKEGVIPDSIPVYTIYYTTNTKKSRNNRHSLFKKRLSPYIYNLVNLLRKGSISKSWNYLKNKKIVCLAPSYQWGYTAELFEKRKYSIINIYNDQLINVSSIMSSKDFVGIIGIDVLLIYNSTYMGNIVRDKINYLIHIGTIQFVPNYIAASKFLIKYSVKAIMFSAVVSPYSWIILEAAKQLGINTFCWGHGASGQAKFTKQMEYELLICDYYFCQGLGSQHTYNSYKQYKFAPIPIGFPSLDVLVKRHKSFTPKHEYQFLYVTTAFYRQNLYFSFSPGIFDNLLYKQQLQILDFLYKKNEHSIVKLNSFENTLYTKYLNRNVVFESNNNFTDLLGCSSVIIIDCPTTTLLEALTTNKPIFISTKFIKLNKLAEKLLSKRAVCCQNTNDLINSLEVYYNSRNYLADIYNTEYLEAFGTHMNDCESAIRGVNAVLARI